MATTSYGYDSYTTWNVNANTSSDATIGNDRYVRYEWNQQYHAPIFNVEDIKQCIDNDGWDPESNE